MEVGRVVIQNPDPTRHDGTILRMRGWYYWRCACGAQAGAPFYSTAMLASEAWADHVKDAEEASR